MKLKGKSVGPNNIPITERCYFLVHLPITGSNRFLEEPKGIFVSSTWSVGRVIDSISDLLNIPNFNNIAKAQKLRLFNYFNGEIVSTHMDVSLNELLNNGTLTNGQDIILEYSSDNKIDSSLYT